MSRLAALVRAEVTERFASVDGREVMSTLETTALPLIDDSSRDRERARVHLAILKLSKGDLAEFRRAVDLARRDWRDVLVAAGLANGDWPDVLRREGWRVPE
jgi:hypothetical protein